MLKPNESLQPLGNGVEVIVSDMYHFSTDTILLSDFASPKPGDSVVELGTGCGTMPLLWTRQNPIKQVVAVDIQSEAIDMLSRSIAHNQSNSAGHTECIKPICADLKALKGVCGFGSFDLVVCNPPYKLSGTGIKNPDKQKLLARHEETCTLDDICRSAASLLQFSGRFCMCQRPERLTDVMLALRSHDLEPKRLRFVQQRRTKEPKLFLIEARYKGKPGFMGTMPTLFIENDKGGFSDEMMKIYGTYKEGKL